MRQMPYGTAAQRARGRAALHLEDGAIRRWSETGCLKIRFPRPLPGAPRTAILINTAGGITGGDELRTEIEVAGPARITTQAAERFYRASRDSPPATIETRLRLSETADIAWLPHETIVFDGSRTARRLLIDLAPGARFLAIEPLVLGRLASGERLRDVTLHDRITIVRDGRPVLVDALRLTGDLESKLARPAIAAGARAVATLIATGNDPDPLRALFARRTLARDGLEAAASTCHGLVVARLLARDGAALHLACIEALGAYHCS